MPGLVLGVRLVLAAVFAVAGTAKLLDAAGSRAALEGFGVPRAAARLAGMVLPAAELAIAAGLLVPASAWWSALAAAGLLAVFMAAIGVSMARGAAPDCHCFGRLHSAPVSWRTQVRNGVLAAAAGVAVLAGRGASGLSPVRWACPPDRRGARARRRRRGAVRGGGGARLVPRRACPGRTAGSWPVCRSWSSGSASAARLGPRGWRVCGRPAARAPFGVLPSVGRPGLRAACRRRAARLAAGAAGPGIAGAAPLLSSRVRSLPRAAPAGGPLAAPASRPPHRRARKPATCRAERRHASDTRAARCTCASQPRNRRGLPGERHPERSADRRQRKNREPPGRRRAGNHPAHRQRNHQRPPGRPSGGTRRQRRGTKLTRQARTCRRRRGTRPCADRSAGPCRARPAGPGSASADTASRILVVYSRCYRGRCVRLRLSRGP